ncbi:hypothetical protein [Erwinia sorbitola]|uniref:Porin family protein n=1 Tax=Erwinia sorbitola TaxID=2681984 RepID=A0A6I6EPJ0_9GAMM|nr:hypothetical protein [Erwinia sorbitola]MTD28469.1 hypothetical protein [Erwinia sorbitola]QGU86582.1 hypothetical protein GN242_04830 [Erwinia sorbitola]
MRKYPCTKVNVLTGLFLFAVPLTFAWADVPNARKTPLSLDYHNDGTDSLGDNEVQAPEPPDLFGKSTGPLPFFGDEIRKRGYDLPDPYGIGFNYMNIHQNIKVKSIQFSNLKIPGLFPGMKPIPLPGNMFNINVGRTREKSKTETARLDTWLFPFLNVYGIVGHTRGSSVSNVSVCTLGTCPGQLKNMDFTLKFKGTTYGGGTTLAYGYHNWFGTLDFNYTRTSFNILDGSISAYTFTPRVGYRFTIPGSAKYSIPVSHASLWVGSMYQDVDQDFRGSLSNLHMPANLVDLVNFVNQDKKGHFRVKQHLKSPWNILVGGQYELTRNFNIITEVGFEKRNSLMVGGEFRF